MNNFKQERIHKFLEAMAMTRTLVDGHKEYNYSLCKTTNAKNFLIRYLSQCTEYVNKHDLSKLIEIEDMLHKDEYLTEIIEWKSALKEKLQNWFFISDEDNEDVQMADDLIFLLTDLLKDDDIKVWGLSHEIMDCKNSLKNVIEFDAMLFVKGEDCYLLHFQNKSEN